MKKAAFFILLSILLSAQISWSQQDTLSRNRFLEMQVDRVVETMSLERKVAQLVCISFTSNDSQADRSRQDEFVSNLGIGGVMPLRGQLYATLERINQFQRSAKIPLMVCVDGEYGLAMRFREFPAYPSNLSLAQYPDSVLVEVGRGVAAELKQVNFTVDFAPVIDVNNNPGNKVIGNRSYGSDPDTVSRKGCAFIRGMQSEGIIACAKHFPGHGDTSVDSHKGLPVLNFSRERLDKVELVPFRAAIEAGVKMIMVGHLSVPSLDPSGTPASISRIIVTDLLRREMGFNGLIVTDALNMKGVLNACGGDGAKAALEAYKAGADILLMPLDAGAAVKLIADKIKSGELSESELDEKVRRVLLAKAQAGLLDPSCSPLVNTAGVNLQISAELLNAFSSDN